MKIDEPFECDVCKQKKMIFTKAKLETQMGNVGLFSLPLNIGEKTVYLHPITAICGNCNQIKFFLEPGGRITE